MVIGNRIRSIEYVLPFKPIAVRHKHYQFSILFDVCTLYVWL
jgi:hypothetical protein